MEEGNSQGSQAQGQDFTSKNQIFKITSYYQLLNRNTVFYLQSTYCLRVVFTVYAILFAVTVLICLHLPYFQQRFF
jgi:hypothetical protein